MTTAVLFPGQGSQRVGMGAELFERYPAIEKQASDRLGYSVRELCLGDPDGKLGDTRYTQPATYVVNALAWRAAREDGLVAHVLLGHSAGEYAALLAAEVFDFDAGLTMVIQRARVTARASGGMSAVLGLDPTRITEVLLQAGLDGVDLASLNAVNQTVLAGPIDQLEAAAVPLIEAGAMAVRRLDVSGPFHSRYMRTAARAFARFIHRYDLAAPEVPVISNLTAREYPSSGIARLLIEQIDHPVRWAESLGHVMRLDPGADFVELGGTAVLRSTVRKARQQAERAPMRRPS